MAGVSRTNAESWLELLVIKVNDWKPLSSAIVFRELPPESCGDPGHAADNLRNSDILIHYVITGFAGLLQ